MTVVSSVDQVAEFRKKTPEEKKTWLISAFLLIPISLVFLILHLLFFQDSQEKFGQYSFGFRQFEVYHPLEKSSDNKVAIRDGKTNQKSGHFVWIVKRYQHDASVRFQNYNSSSKIAEMFSSGKEYELFSKETAPRFENGTVLTIDHLNLPKNEPVAFTFKNESADGSIDVEVKEKTRILDAKDRSEYPFLVGGNDLMPELFLLTPVEFYVKAGFAGLILCIPLSLLMLGYSTTKKGNGPRQIGFDTSQR
jgi:hypothetical protein